MAALSLCPLRVMVALVTFQTVLVHSNSICDLRCPGGQRCELQLVQSDHLVHYWPVCVDTVPVAPTEQPPPATPTESPPLNGTSPANCARKTCPAGFTCLLQEVQCVTEPCLPQPICTPDRCAKAICPVGYKCLTAVIPGSNPHCGDFPLCRYKPTCVPVAKPKPGFCPLAPTRDQALARCELDTDCAADLRCCPSAAGGGRCVAPLSDPCGGACPGRSYDSPGVCVVRNGRAECRENPNCVPGSYYCHRHTQSFCTDGADLVGTGIHC
ncbi:keratin-associated protein 16-1-like [Amphibalanus amphitrite]|uniref:keratin-associated protein 16-1-like n=1 Tax=Amphibalanus amphitrite TaxID=1232801 RepID=UPI001C921EFB|nr:keratin-associated protein 16-1-like [Amphibalanus amphitrite]